MGHLVGRAPTVGRVQRPWVLTTVRWVLTAVGVALLVLLMWHLSRWQWHKHLARDTEISRQQDNLRAPVVGLDSLVRSPAVPTAEQWRRVRATGRYDRAHQIVVTLRTVGGVGGSEVLTPLQLPDGRAVLCDRGFYAVPDSAPAGSPGIAPEAPAGPVAAVGYLQLPEGPSRPPAAEQGQVTLTQIDPAAAERVLGYPVITGYLTLMTSSPAQPGGLTAIEPPSYDTGPYLSYSVQWIIFCVIAVGGLVVLGIDEFGGGDLGARLRRADAASVASMAAAAGRSTATGDGRAPTAAAGADGAGQPAPVVVALDRSHTTVLAGNAGSRPGLEARFFDGDDEDDLPPSSGGIARR